MSGRTWPTCAAVGGLTLLLLALGGPTQTGGDDKGEKKVDIKPVRPNALILLVREAKGLPQVEITNTLTRGLDLAGCKFDGEVRPRAISSVVFNTLNSVQDLPSAGEERKEFNLQPAPELPGTWLVSHKRGFTLDQMEVETEAPTKDGMGREPRTHKLKPAFRLPVEKDKVAPPDPPLTMLYPTLYSLRLQRDETPIRYKAQLSPRSKDEKAWETGWQNFPSTGDRFYLIVLNNFNGDKQRLFDFIQNKHPEQKDDSSKILANPVTNIEEAREMSLVFAAWGMRSVRRGSGFNGFNHTPEIDVPEGSVASHVWIRFPLTKAQYEADLKKYQGMDSVTIMKEIKKDGPTKAGFRAVLSPDSKPAWVEMEAMKDTGNRRFTRAIELKDVAKLQDLYPNMYRLVVWETGNQAILIENPTTKRLVSVLGEEVAEWPQGIRNLVGKTPEKKVPEKKD